MVQHFECDKECCCGGGGDIRRPKTTRKNDEVIDLCEPVMRYMAEHYGPHDILVITEDTINIYSGELGIHLVT